MTRVGGRIPAEWSSRNAHPLTLALSLRERGPGDAARYLYGFPLSQAEGQGEGMPTPTPLPSFPNGQQPYSEQSACARSSEAAHC